MTHGFSDAFLSQFSQFVATQMGLHFPRERWRDLERGIRSVAREFDFEDAEACGRWLLSSRLTRNQIETLASHLTIGETYFFREKKSFQIIEEQVFPALIDSRRKTEKRLRIWSAGCCTGEEPYSIAILLGKLIPDLQDWNITILATDINPRFLQRASEGVYSEWSFRDTPLWIKESYFNKTQVGRFEILPQIKKRVTFSYLNLAEDAYPSLLNNTNAMDAIFCRNVLMYFAPEPAKTVIQNLYRSLVDGGWLIVSPSETSHVLFSEFVTVNHPGAIIYRKVLNSVPQLSRADSTIATSDFGPQTAEPQPQTNFSPDTRDVLSLEGRDREPDLSAAEGTAKPQVASYREASALYEQGCYDQAETEIIALLSKNPDDARVMGLLARVYANRGRLREALEWCEKAIAADKLNPVGHYLQATILQERGSVEEAKAALRRALYLHPDFALAHFALGNLARCQGRLKEGKKHLENARSLLSSYRPDDLVPESDGMTAGRLLEIIESATHLEVMV